MKSFLTLIFFTFFVVNVKGQASTLEHILNPTKKCTDITTVVYSKKDRFCSSSLHLNSDSTFTYEAGCEGHSGVSVGNYEIIKDSLFLFPLANKDILPFCKVEESGITKNDSLVTFILKDKRGVPCNDLIVPKGRAMDIHDPIMLQVLLNNWKDTLRINKFTVDSLEMPRLFSLTGKSFVFATKDLGAIVKITLNLNLAAILYDDVIYLHNKLPKAWSMKKRKIFSKGIELERRK